MLRQDKGNMVYGSPNGGHHEYMGEKPPN
ncbi:hypothetical protein AVEN_10321-1, partial [Araneus ventricosus]